MCAPTDISGSVPEAILGALYKNAYKALKPGGRLLVHDFMVNDSLDSPALGALWALQHVTVNADGIGLCPFEGARARTLPKEPFLSAGSPLQVVLTLLPSALRVMCVRVLQ